MEYKLSKYTIFTDPIEEIIDAKLEIRYLLYSTITNQVLLISSEVKNKIENGHWQDLCKDTMDELLQHKFLVPIELNELNEIIQENKNTIANESLLYFVIQPTAFCQLGCDYCGQDHKKVNLNKSLYTSLINRIASKIENGNFNALKIGWFGGEPLVGLKQIRELTPLFKEFCDAKGLNYMAKIVTNGLSLKESIFEELVNELNIKEIEVTLDGIAEFHDQRRHTKSKEDTFDIIFKNLKTIIDRNDFLSLNVRLSIRCNVDKRNWEGVSPLIKLLAENGFPEKIAYFYPIGVYSWGNDAHMGSLTKEEFAEKEIDWIIEMIKVGFRPSLLPGRVKSVCLAVSPTAEMIDAYGNIFNCTEVSYVDKYKDTNYILGNLKINEVNSSITRPLSDWNDQILYSSELPCTSCVMLPVCGGACPKSWNEDMRACPSNKFNIKQKLLLSYLTTKETFFDAIQEVN